MAIRDVLAPVITLILMIAYAAYIVFGLLLFSLGIYYTTSVQGANDFVTIVAMAGGFFMMVVGGIGVFANLKKNTLLCFVCLLVDIFLFVFLLAACIVGIFIANALYFFIYRKYFKALAADNGQAERRELWAEREDPIPFFVTFIHIGFLAWTVLNAHDPPLFILGFMFFLGFTQTTGHHQNEVSMKSPLLVGFFLAGLVIHGKCQSWWIKPLITSIDNNYILMVGSTVLTAFNDNAAITYLASQAPGLSIGAKYAILAGAVTGGGLTVIANAPNPAGQSILGKYFKGGVIPLKLVKAALIPTVIMGACFMLIPSKGMTVDPLDKVEHHGEHKGDEHDAEHTDAGLEAHHEAHSDLSH